MHDRADQFIARMEEAAFRGLSAIGVEATNDIRLLLSVPGRTQGTKVLKSGPNKGQSRTVWGRLGSAPSKPGEAPHKQTGTLRSSIAWSVDRERLVVRIGTALKYGKYLELGTAKMQPRPFLRPTLANHKTKYAALLSAQLKGAGAQT